MKSLRILVLVLLAVLLPARGAFAGAMWCASHGAAHGTPDVEIGAPMPHTMPHDHAAVHDGHHAHSADAAQPAPPADGHAAATCQFCASGCCMASIVASVPAIGPAPLTALAEFPALTVPVPAFESGGPERPPRAC